MSAALPAYRRLRDARIWALAVCISTLGLPLACTGPGFGPSPDAGSGSLERYADAGTGSADPYPANFSRALALAQVTDSWDSWEAGDSGGDTSGDDLPRPCLSPIEFSSDAIERAVRFEARISHGDPLTEAEVDGIKKLEVDVEDFRSLEGLQCLHGIEHLEIDGGVSLKDIEFIAGLTQLRHLRIHVKSICSGASTAAAFRELRQLEHLDVEGCSFGNDQVEAFGGLTKLRYLRLVNDNLSDFPDLSSLTELQQLLLTENNLVHITPLLGATALRVLDLRNNEIVDLDGISRLQQLEQLNLAGNSLNRLDPLVGLAKLRVLDLTTGQFVHLDPLSQLPQLEELSLANNYLEEFSALHTLKALQRLDVSANVHGVLDVLPELEQLRELDTSSLAMPQLRPVAGASQLQIYHCRHCGLTEIDELSSSSNLQALHLGYNEIIDIDPLTGLPLKVLDLGHNRVEDLTPVATLPLDTLRLQYNRFSDISALYRRRFSYLDLRGNGVDCRASAETLDWLERNVDEFYVDNCR